MSSSETAKIGALVGSIVLVLSGGVRAHTPGAMITWNREVSRIVYERCASCHRPGGSSFSLMTFQDAQPRAAAIKHAVLSRSMPPWGGVKGFGDFRNDQGLSQEQIELVTDWVEGGAPRGNNPNALPAQPKFAAPASFKIPSDGLIVQDELTLSRAVTLEGLVPQLVPSGSSIQIVAVLPDGTVEPLVWLYEYKDGYRHPFLFRKPLGLPAGTVIRGVRPPAKIILLRSTSAKPAPQGR